jgi:hypothetical protein
MDKLFIILSKYRNITIIFSVNNIICKIKRRFKRLIIITINRIKTTGQVDNDFGHINLDKHTSLSCHTH